jgi:hypothetical protein
MILRNQIGQFASLHKLVIKAIVIIWLVAGILFLLSYGLNVWSSKDRLIQKPVVVLLDVFTRPVLVSTPKKTIVIYPTIKIDETEKDLTPIESYIKAKFGYDYKIMLAIAKAESGLNPSAYHANDNGSIDIGILQINSSHFKQVGCSLPEVIDPYKNIDCAYSIYKASGMTAWSAFNNGSYLAKY